MKKTWIMLLSILLLIAMVGPTALAVHPSQMGDQGGQVAAQYNPNNNSNNISAPYVETPSETESYQPNTYVPDSNYLTVEPGTTGAGETYPGGVPEIISSDVPTPIIVPVGEDGTIQTDNSGAQSLDWYGVGFDLINANKNITVYDINTGVTWGGTYINGKNHADVIPASASDATKLSQNGITGDYVRRPVIVTIAGSKYAGSMYAVGHGDTSYCDYFSGVMCIHFTGSQTHGSQKVDSDHQNAISEALTYSGG